MNPASRSESVPAERAGPPEAASTRSRSAGRLRTRTGHAMVFPAGLVATAAGAGLLLPRLAAGAAGLGVRPAIETVAATLTLLGGCVLLVAGARAAVRDTRGPGRLAMIVVLLGVTYVGLWSGVQAVAATNAVAEPIGSATPADSGLRYQEASFVTRDGSTLSGWYIPSTNGAAVALAHGSGSTRSAVLGHAVVLARHGYGILLYDARGHGRSTGRAMDFGWHGDADLEAAVSYLLARPDVDDGRVALVGLSMGGEEAIGAAAADDRVRAVVAEGATGRIALDREWLSEQYGVRGAVQEQIDRLTYAIADLLSDAEAPIGLSAAVAAAAPCPVLLIAAGAEPDEAFAGRHLQQASPATVDLWVVPGSAHTGGLGTAPGEWEDRVTAFLAATVG